MTTAGLVSMTNLPAIDPGGPIRTAANDLVNAAKDVSDHATNIQRTWSKLSPVYHAPEQHLVLAAMDPPANTADELLKDAHSAKKALDTFADACDSFIRSKRLLISDFATFENTDHGDPDDPRADTQYVHARHGFDLRAQAIADGLHDAQVTCTNALKAIGVPSPVAPAPERLTVDWSLSASGRAFAPAPAPVLPIVAAQSRATDSFLSKAGGWTGGVFRGAWTDISNTGSGGAKMIFGGLLGLGTTSGSPTSKQIAAGHSQKWQSEGNQEFASGAPGTFALLAGGTFGRAGAGTLRAGLSRLPVAGTTKPIYSRVAHYESKAAARRALDGELGPATNRFFRSATSKSTNFKISERPDGVRQFEFFSPARNAGYGKKYVQEIDSHGKVLREYKDTMGPHGLIERKWVHSGE